MSHPRDRFPDFVKFVRRLKGRHVLVSHAAKDFGCMPRTFRRYMQRLAVEHPDLSVNLIEGGELRSLLAAERRDALADTVRAMIVEGKTNNQIRAALRIGEGRLGKIIADNGLSGMRMQLARERRAERAAAAKAARAATPRRQPVNWGRIGAPQPTKVTPVGTVTAAAQFLGRWYRPVYRASISDPRAKADEYQVGRLRMPAIEMLDLARSKGFAA